MAPIQQTADFFIWAAPPGTMTPMKLQKLCAYAQGISLGYLDKELFPDEIEAWKKGPVIPYLYDHYGVEGIITPPMEANGTLDREPFSGQQYLVLETVQINLGNLTGWGLSDRSHLDFPGGFGSKEVITKDAIRKAFKNNIFVQSLRNTDRKIDTETCRWVNAEDVLRDLDC